MLGRRQVAPAQGVIWVDVVHRQHLGCSRCGGTSNSSKDSCGKKGRRNDDTEQHQLNNSDRHSNPAKHLIPPPSLRSFFDALSGLAQFCPFSC